MKRCLRILHIEDNPCDVELVRATLADEGIDSEAVIVSTRNDFEVALQRKSFDLIIADFALPSFHGMTALSLTRQRYPDLPFIFVSGKSGEEAVIESLRNGATDYVLKNRLSQLAPAIQRALDEAEERAEHIKAEEALRESEMRRYLLQTELAFVAEIQSRLLPRGYPDIPGFEIAARCLPARQVGGDFYDWQESNHGGLILTLGDVMGTGMAAAILMATVRAAIRSVAIDNRPSDTLRLAERALLPDLENSESFVTLFHGHLDAMGRCLDFVDCGHGYVFMLRATDVIEALLPRGLPMGVPGRKLYEEGTISFAKGDTLVVYSDGLIDARPDLKLDNEALADCLKGAAGAGEMVERLVGLTETRDPLPDDVTVLVVMCSA